MMYLSVFGGCDGSGKSTIIEALKSHYPATYIKEPSLDATINILKETTNPHTKVDLFTNDRKQIYKTKFEGTVISDRSFICNMVYQSLELPYTPIKSLYYIFRLQRTIPLPNQVFYVTANPTIIEKRLTSRNEPLTLDQIKAIQQRYLTTLQLLDIEPIIIDTSYLTIDQCVMKCVSYLPSISP
jgi:thymidylate kinase